MSSYLYNIPKKGLVWSTVECSREKHPALCYLAPRKNPSPGLYLRREARLPGSFAVQVPIMKLNICRYFDLITRSSTGHPVVVVRKGLSNTWSLVTLFKISAFTRPSDLNEDHIFSPFPHLYIPNFVWDELPRIHSSNDQGTQY